MSLEERVSRDEAAIVEASVRNDGPAIREASLSLAVARRRIEELYDRLSALGMELQEKEREFESAGSA